jgi:hypothetical protein
MGNERADYGELIKRGYFKKPEKTNQLTNQMSTQRKNQATLTTAEWNAFIDAINKVNLTSAATPKYSAFYKVHEKAMDMNNPTGLSWGVHTMVMGGGMVMADGRNFLSWHRQFILQLEKRLQKVNASVSIPYWDWMQDRQLPAALNTPALLKKWKITRNWNGTNLPNGAQMKNVKSQTNSFPTKVRWRGCITRCIMRSVGP